MTKCLKGNVRGTDLACLGGEEKWAGRLSAQQEGEKSRRTGENREGGQVIWEGWGECFAGNGSACTSWRTQKPGPIRPKKSGSLGVQGKEKDLRQERG